MKNITVLDNLTTPSGTHQGNDLKVMPSIAESIKTTENQLVDDLMEKTPQARASEIASTNMPLSFRTTVASQAIKSSLSPKERTRGRVMTLLFYRVNKQLFCPTRTENVQLLLVLIEYWLDLHMDYLRVKGCEHAVEELYPSLALHLETVFYHYPVSPLVHDINHSTGEELNK